MSRWRPRTTNVRLCHTFMAFMAFMTAGVCRQAAALDARKDFSQYSQSQWSSDDGVIGDFVLAITRTRDGFVWVGTRSGLLRFDGVKFTPQLALDADLLEHQRVEALLADGHGGLWAGTDRSLIRLHHGVFRTAWPSPEPIHTLTKASDGSIWIGTARGLFKFRDKRLPFPGEEHLAGLSVRAVVEHGDGTLWVGSDTGLYRLSGGAVTKVSHESGEPDSSIRALLLDEAGALWIGNASGALYKWQKGGLSKQGVIEANAPASVTALAKDDAHNIWIGTSMGVARLSAEGELRLFGQESFSDPRVASLFFDEDHNLWIGSHAGLMMVHDGDFTTITHRQGLPTNTIRVVLPAGAQSVWIGSGNKGLFTWNGREPTLYDATRGLKEPEIRALHRDAAGQIWAGTSGGLYRGGEDGFALIRAEGANPSPEVGSIAKAHTGGLWVGTRHAGLFRMEGDRLRHVPLSPPPFGWVRPVHEDANGRLWFGTQDGRLVWVGAEGRVVEEQVQGLRYPRAFKEEGDTLWVGFRGGLARLRKGVWKAWTSREGLPATSMSQIIDDDVGNLWLGGALGIMRVDKASLNAYLDGHAEGPVYRTFRRADGLQSTECSLQPGSAKTEDGRLWFPTMGGVAVIDPRAPEVPAPAPRVHLADVDIDGRAYAPNAAIVAPPGPGTLGFHYTAPTFREPLKLLFRYRLEGLDHGWVEGDDRRFARYNNVPPGRYRFVVQARHKEGLWPTQQASLFIELEPRFVQTKTFAFLMSAILLGLLYLAWRMQKAIERRRHELVAQERLRIARDLHDNLDQSLFAATLQLDLANKLLPQPERATSHIALARNLLSHFQEEARRSIAHLRAQDLDSSSGSLKAALGRALPRLDPSGGIAIHLEVDKAIEHAPLAVKSELLKIAQELASNAVRHGQPKSLWLQLQVVEKDAVLQVRDDGRGFDVNDTAGAAEGHFGLTGVRERVRWLGGQFTLQSAPHEGTTARLVLPLSLNPG